MTPDDFDAILACLENGFYAVESFKALSAGGDTLPDHRREYWIQTTPRRVARVDASRDPAGRWRVNTAAFYRLEPCGPAATPEQRAELAGAIPEKAGAIA